MEFQLAKEQDLPGIRALWQEAFGDSPEAVDEFFSAFPSCRSYVARTVDRVCAMVHVLPQILRAEGDSPAGYVYAVATAEQYRGQGLCRELMAFSEQDLALRGFACAVLTPGEPSLFRFYEKLGYEAVFTRNRTAFSGGQEISVEEYAELREGCLPIPHMVYDLDTLRYAQKIYGLRFYRTANGCAATSDTYTAECLPEDLGGAPFAMVKWLGDRQAVKNAYLGLALE